MGANDAGGAGGDGQAKGNEFIKGKYRVNAGKGGSRVSEHEVEHQRLARAYISEKKLVCYEIRVPHKEALKVFMEGWGPALEVVENLQVLRGLQDVQDVLAAGEVVGVKQRIFFPASNQALWASMLVQVNLVRQDDIDRAKGGEGQLGCSVVGASYRASYHVT